MIWILVLVYQVTAGNYGVGYAQQDNLPIQFQTESACMEAAKEKLEHAPKYVTQATARCVEMRK